MITHSMIHVIKLLDTGMKVYKSIYDEPPHPFSSLTILLFFTLVIIIILVLIFLFIRRKAESPCKILMLGPQNAGKTIFLASMYYRFEVEDPDVGFFLDTEPKQREQLLNYRRQITDASKSFPPGTQLKELTEWKFSCYAKAAGDICTVARFTYLDYAGERIKYLYQQQNQHSPEFQRIITNANVLVGILNGHELLNLMEKKNVREFYENSLRPILFILQRSKSPIHLVITKWDILEGKYSLGEIRKSLEEFDDFKHFVATHRKLNTLRLIPVSALGSGFAQLEPDGITMKKVPNANLHPFQIEMPLACVLYDSLHDNLKKLKIDKNSQFSNALTSAPSPIAMFLIFFYWLFKSITLSWGGPIGLSFQIFLGGISVIDFLQASNSTSNSSGGMAQNRREAIEQIVVNFGKLLDKLAKNYPESDLTDYNAGNHP